ncbi:MAG: glycosyltransferase family 9 protein [Ignavibacteriales bacterium]|nr:glycosyltransferase family 9 protein [Ignavibacteriales bacterium]
MRIVIFVGGGIGDVLMTTPMFRAIKKKYPESRVVVTVMGSSQATILLNNSNVDFIINLKSPKWSGALGFIRLLLFFNKEKFQYSFLNHIAERRKYFLLSFLSGTKNRVGFNRSKVAREKTYFLFVKLLNQPINYNFNSKLRTELNLELLKVLDIRDNDISYDLPITKKIIKKKRKIIGIHPGSNTGGELKRWQFEKFDELCKKINEAFGFSIRFFIGPEEEYLSKRINPKYEQIINVSLLDAIDKIAECDYFISNDSGLAHIAAAFKVPTIVLFGPTLKNEYILPTKYIAIDSGELECRPCFHLRKPCPIDQLCLKNITAEEVFFKFAKLIEA